MWHSQHPAALLHATARAASGGPVYVSDAPGRHDGTLLQRLVLSDGSVLRPALPARPTADALFSDVLRDRRSLLKVLQATFAQLATLPNRNFPAPCSERSAVKEFCALGAAWSLSSGG